MSTTHLFILSRSIPPDTGGYQRQMAILAPYLRRRVRRITWIGGVRTPSDVVSSPIAGVDRLIRVRTGHLPTALRGIASPTVVLYGFVLILWAALRRDDVRLLLLSPGIPGAPAAVRLLRRLRVPVVARYPTSGDLTERRGRSVGSVRGVRAIAPSPLQTREQTAFPVMLVPNAVAPSTEDVADDGVDRVGRVRRFVYVGRLIRRKRTDLLVEAWRAVCGELPDWELVLVGDGGFDEDSVENDLRTQLSAGGISRVVLTGDVDDPSAVLRSGDVFVFPSIKEGQPNAVLEAYAAGLPVIAHPAHMAEWFEPTPPLLPWSGQPHELAQAMRCAAHRHDLVELGAEGRAFVQEHHRPERTAELVASALEVT